MDENLRDPLKKLAEALHAVIARAPEVEEALHAVRSEGYQPVLMLEVTVALSSTDREEGPDDDELVMLETEGPEIMEIFEDEEREGRELGARITPDDREFLRSIRIRIDD